MISNHHPDDSDAGSSAHDPDRVVSQKPVNRAVQQLQSEGSRSRSPSFHVRRGSDSARSVTEDELTEEAMANAERELAADAEWKRIQKNTFTRWANEHLRQVNKHIEDLRTDLSDGLKLIALIEVLSGKRMPKHNKKPNFRSQKLENVSIALQFLEMEGITLVNIDSTDIVDCKLKLILGLIWTLILHYAISMPMWEGPPLGGGGPVADKTPKQRLMNWVQDKIPDVPINNFTNDWNNGKAVGALVDSVAPGLCPDWEDWDPDRPIENAREAMDLADKWLNVPKLLKPEEIVNPNVDEQSMMTYLSQFPNAKLKPGAPLRKKTNVSKVRAYGPGLEPKGLVAKAPAKFVVETFGAGDGDVTVKVTGPKGEDVPCEIINNHDRKKTYSCKYFPETEGDFQVKIYFANREIPKSPYKVNVEGFAGDPNKVTASGPGLEPEGVMINKPTYFNIDATKAGKGSPEVIIVDPKGLKDTVPISITPLKEENTYKCEYVATSLGLHSVNVFFAGNPIPKSPFGVKVSPSSIPSKVWTSGKGLQPHGIRVNETVEFQVHTEGAGEGNVAVKILGPGGLPVRAVSKKLDEFTTEFIYTPVKQGRHIIMITFANQEIPKSPFEVRISPQKRSNIKAYGPGLKGGIVNKPAKFTVDTCGETGGLGFSIEGPSEAEITCDDNGDGSADVEYIPTEVGEYAVHILCDDEDIPGSPFMAQIVPATDFFPEKVKVFGPGVENGVNPKETTHFTIDITDAGKAPLDVSIMDDLGEFQPKIKEVSEGIFNCSYQPRKDQHKQTVMVNFGGCSVPGSPFRVQNDNPNDPSKVKVYGPGVEPGNVRARKPIDFTVDCRKSGPGDLNVSIESKSKKSVPITMGDNKDGTYKIGYEPTEPGSQTITIKLDGKEIPQSPIKLDVQPGPDLSKIKLTDFETEVFVDCPSEFEVDASDVSPKNEHSQITCDITGPSGEPVESFVAKLEPDGDVYQVSYIPTEEGNYDIGLKYDGEPLPDSPYPVVASYGCDPSRVKAYGDGLEKGFVDEPNEFIVSTKNAGAGGLGLAIEGPSEALVNCIDNKDGTATVEYTPTEEGDYDIAVKFGDENIPGSPFSVPVSTRDGIPKPNSEKVRAYGPGLEPASVLPGKRTSFIVDATDTSPAPVSVMIVNDKGKPIGKKPTIEENGDGTYDVSYVPPPVGEPFQIGVFYGGIEIPESPFNIMNNPSLEDIMNSPRTMKDLGLSDKRKPEIGETDELVQAKNGTGLMKKKSKDGSAPGGVADLIKNTLPENTFGRERGGRPSLDEDHDGTEHIGGPDDRGLLGHDGRSRDKDSLGKDSKNKGSRTRKGSETSSDTSSSSSSSSSSDESVDESSNQTRKGKYGDHDHPKSLKKDDSSDKNKGENNLYKNQARSPKEAAKLKPKDGLSSSDNDKRLNDGKRQDSRGKISIDEPKSEKSDKEGNLKGVEPKYANGNKLRSRNPETSQFKKSPSESSSRKSSFDDDNSFKNKKPKAESKQDGVGKGTKRRNAEDDERSSESSDEYSETGYPHDKDGLRGKYRNQSVDESLRRRGSRQGDLGEGGKYTRSGPEGRSKSGEPLVENLGRKGSRPGDAQRSPSDRTGPRGGTKSGDPVDGDHGRRGSRPGDSGEGGAYDRSGPGGRSRYGDPLDGDQTRKASRSGDSGQGSPYERTRSGSRSRYGEPVDGDLDRRGSRSEDVGERDPCDQTGLGRRSKSGDSSDGRHGRKGSRLGDSREGGTNDRSGPAGRSRYADPINDDLGRRGSRLEDSGELGPHNRNGPGDRSRQGVPLDGDLDRRGSRPGDSGEGGKYDQSGPGDRSQYGEPIDGDIGGRGSRPGDYGEEGPFDRSGPGDRSRQGEPLDGDLGRRGSRPGDRSRYGEPLEGDLGRRGSRPRDSGDVGPSDRIGPGDRSRYGEPFDGDLGRRGSRPGDSGEVGPYNHSRTGDGSRYGEPLDGDLGRRGSRPGDRSRYGEPFDGDQSRRGSRPGDSGEVGPFDGSGPGDRSRQVEPLDGDLGRRGSRPGDRPRYGEPLDGDLDRRGSRPGYSGEVGPFDRSGPEDRSRQGEPLDGDLGRRGSRPGDRSRYGEPLEGDLGRRGSRPRDSGDVGPFDRSGPEDRSRQGEPIDGDLVRRASRPGNSGEGGKYDQSGPGDKSRLGEPLDGDIDRRGSRQGDSGELGPHNRSGPGDRSRLGGPLDGDLDRRGSRPGDSGEGGKYNQSGPGDRSRYGEPFDGGLGRRGSRPADSLEGVKYDRSRPGDGSRPVEPLDENFGRKASRPGGSSVFGPYDHSRTGDGSRYGEPLDGDLAFRESRPGDSRDGGPYNRSGPGPRSGYGEVLNDDLTTGGPRPSVPGEGNLYDHSGPRDRSRVGEPVNGNLNIRGSRPGDSVEGGPHDRIKLGSRPGDARERVPYDRSAPEDRSRYGEPLDGDLSRRGSRPDPSGEGNLNDLSGPEDRSRHGQPIDGDLSHRGATRPGASGKGDFNDYDNVDEVGLYPKDHLSSGLQKDSSAVYDSRSKRGLPDPDSRRNSSIPQSRSSISDNPFISRDRQDNPKFRGASAELASPNNVHFVHEPLENRHFPDDLAGKPIPNASDKRMLSGDSRNNLFGPRSGDRRGSSSSYSGGSSGSNSRKSSNEDSSLGQRGSHRGRNLPDSVLAGRNPFMQGENGAIGNNNANVSDHSQPVKDKSMLNATDKSGSVPKDMHDDDSVRPILSRGSSRPDVFDKSSPGDSLLTGDPLSHYPLVELNNIPLTSTDGNVEAVVKTPSGKIAHPYIEDDGNGSLGLSYQPTERGPHLIDVKNNGEHVQGSPYKFYASPTDDSKVHAYGPGLTHGVCGDPSDFVISTKGAGAGGLSLAVDGPSKVDINCHDNKDGTINVSYLPTAPGEYKISAMFADQHIEGSPFTCKVTGEGKKRNAISVGASSDVQLPDNLSDYDLRALDAHIVSPSGNEEPCFLKKLPKGNTGISFTPKEVGEHLVSVKRNGKHIKNSPFKIKVSPGDVGDASKVNVKGPGLVEGKTHQDNVFHVDTKSAGYGGLSMSVEGPSKAEIRCKDHEDGTLDVSYKPTEPGLYIVNLKFADQHVPGSPFTVPVKGRGSKREEEKIRHMREAVPVTEVGSQCRLTFKMPGISSGIEKDLDAAVSSPSGKANQAAITELEDGLYAVNFVPYELGVHTVTVRHREVDIPGSPFQFTVGPLKDGGAHKVHAGGPGLERGVQGRPADFNVWTREAGHGSLAISVEGPSKAVVDYKDRKDGSCHVSYIVEEPGEYSVGIRFNDQHIPGSPYKVYIQPSADDAERVRLSNIADGPVKPDLPQTMLLNMNGAEGDVECRIVAPSGREDDCFITPLGNGEHSVRFVPKEEGVHYLHARFNGVHISGSPFKIIVGNLKSVSNDASTVAVHGKGIQFGTTGKRSVFLIDTSNVGAGTLSITVDGPSKVDLTCDEVESGYEVSYTPMVPGKYYVTVKYNGRNVSGSPFSVNISGDALITETSSELNNRNRRSSRSSMTMETLKRTSYIRHQYTEQRTRSSSLHHHEQQKSLMSSRSNSRPIMTHQVNVSDATQVKCSGSGLRGAKIHRHNSFAVDCSRAGNNILYVGVYGPETPCEEVVIKHQGNKRYSVDYIVRERGKYIIFVKWGDDHVPGSPYHIEV